VWKPDGLHHLHAENHAEKVLQNPRVAETTKTNVSSCKKQLQVSRHKRYWLTFLANALADEFTSNDVRELIQVHLTTFFLFDDFPGVENLNKLRTFKNLCEPYTW